MSLKKRLLILTLVLIPALRMGWTQSHKASSSSRTRVASTQSASAATVSYEKPVPQPFVRAEALFQYGTHAFKEDGVSIEGNLMGVLTNLMFPIASSGFQIGIRGEYMSGDVTYTGEYQSTNGQPGGKAKGPGTEVYYDLAGLGHVDIFREKNSDAGFFMGLAYRAEENNQTFAGGYPREISALYLPFGMNTKIGLSENWSIKAEGQFDYLVSGKTTSRMSKNSPDYGDVTHDQNSGYGIRASIRAQYQISKVSIVLGPYYSMWKVEESNSVPTRYQGGTQYMIEPANDTTRYGISLGVLY